LLRGPATPLGENARRSANRPRRSAVHAPRRWRRPTPVAEALPWANDPASPQRRRATSSGTSSNTARTKPFSTGTTCSRTSSAYRAAAAQSGASSHTTAVPVPLPTPRYAVLLLPLEPSTQPSCRGNNARCRSRTQARRSSAARRSLRRPARRRRSPGRTWPGRRHAQPPPASAVDSCTNSRGRVVAYRSRDERHPFPDLARATRALHESPRFLGLHMGCKRKAARLDRLRNPLQIGYGASRTRTGDLLGAIQALSQLSYSPAREQV
jgi:hypothetical protein